MNTELKQMNNEEAITMLKNVKNVEENVVELEFSIDAKTFEDGVMKSYRKNVKKIQSSLLMH